MVTVPGVIPVTRPEAFTVAIKLLLLLHTPPPVVLDSCVLTVVLTEVVPVMGDTTGKELMETAVTAEVAEHPAGLVTVTL